MPFISGKDIFYDNCEVLPLVGWGADPKTHYAMVTGGNQSLSNVDSRTGMRLTNKYKRKGTNCYELFVTKREDYPSCCEWTRSEVMYLAPSQQTWNNALKWIGVSILIDPTFQFENRPCQIGFDSKASPDDLQTPFWLGIIGDQYYIEGYFHPRKMLGQVIKGVWEDWLVERNYSAGSDGYFNFYRNGKLIYSKTGANWFNRGGDAPVSRYQHGLYKWVLATANGQGWGSAVPAGADKAKMTIYIDEIKFGYASGNATLQDFLVDTPNPTPIPPEPVEPLPIPPPVTTVTAFINSGGGSYTGGGAWSADKYFIGGNAYASTAPIAGTTLDPLYQDERFGNFEYKIPVKNGEYLVKLHFAEIYFDAPGQRTFDVLIEGQKVLVNYDVFQKSGGKNIAIVEAMRATVSDGELTIKFVSIINNAKIAAIEVSPYVPPQDMNVYYVSSIEATETITVNGITKTVKSVVITWSDGSKTEIYKK